MTKPSQNLRPHKPDNMQPSSVLFPKNRNSNLELLRIVCMLFIICHHWIVFILDNCGYHVPLGDTKQDYTSVFLNSFFIIGVNCYVLISGYFGIKLSWKPIKKIVGACLFYGALCYFISLAIPPFNSEGFSFLTLLERMYPGNWWFLMEYIVLILLSPMLNKSIENIDSKTFRLYIILLLIVNVGIGYCLNDRVNKTGYNIMNFIMLYYIGRFLNRNFEQHVAYLKRKWLWLVYILSSAMLFIGFIILSKYMDSTRIALKWFGYNNPLVLISSVAFFLIFALTKMKNSVVINTIAASTLVVYICRSSNFSMSPIIRAIFAKVNGWYDFPLSYVCLLGYAIVVFAVIVGFDVSMKTIIRKVKLIFK